MFAAATAKDFQTLMLTRFFAGMFASRPLAVVGGAFSDLFGNETRGIAIAAFSTFVFLGPFISPTVGAFITQSYLGWRWTEYITGIMGALAFRARCLVLGRNVPQNYSTKTSRQYPQRDRKLKANNNLPVPKQRLLPMMVGATLFPIGLFWFALTGNYPSIQWIVPTLSGLLTCAGVMTIFLQALNYLIDAYLIVAASAIAANTFLRSFFRTGFPLFATAMFNNLGKRKGGRGSGDEESKGE
jgi:MFS family permease